MPVSKGIEGFVDEVAVGLGPFQLSSFLHALFVLHTLGFQRRHRFTLHPIKLREEHRPRVFQNGLDQREHVKGVGFRGGIQQGQGIDQVQRLGVWCIEKSCCSSGLATACGQRAFSSTTRLIRPALRRVRKQVAALRRCRRFITSLS